MNRRDALKYTALITGGSIAAPVAMSLLSGCKMEPKITPFVPKLLNTDQYAFVKAVSGTILPESEAMPGAVSVGVPQMIDHMVNVTFSPKDRKRYVQGVSAIMELWSSDPAKSFMTAKPEDQLIWLQDNEKAIALRAEERAAKGIVKEQKFTETQDMGSTDTEEEKPLTPEEKMELADEIYAQVKQQTISYFLSTEEINTKYLNYLPVPGKYEHCIPLAETGGKAWAI